MLCLGWSLHADPASDRAKKSPPTQKSATEKRVSVAEAKERGVLMHDIYASTLEALHHHYFRAERAVLPARAMEDVFADIDEKSKIKTRWISVNTQAMSVDHEPKTDFEKKAAAELADGKAVYERVEKGQYLRAGAIPLGSGCVGCHTKFFGPAPKTPRFAGLVISIPVTEK
jgi:hypothetical protein